jgi:protein subunit release factor A
MRDRIAEIDGLISTAEVFRDQQKYRALMKERAHLSEIVEMFDETQKIAASIHEIEALISE